MVNIGDILWIIDIGCSVVQVTDVLIASMPNSINVGIISFDVISGPIEFTKMGIDPFADYNELVVFNSTRYITKSEKVALNYIKTH